MKKICLVLFALICSLQCAMAQINWGDYSHSYSANELNEPKHFTIVTAIKSVNDMFWDNETESEQASAAFRKDSIHRNSFADDILVRTAYDTSKVHFFIPGINKANASQFEYSVLEYQSKKVLIPYSIINQFSNATVIKASGYPEMGYLGGFKAPLGTTLVVNIRKKGISKPIASAAIIWVSVKPVFQSIYSTSDLDSYLGIISGPDEAYDLQGDKKILTVNRRNLETGLLPISPKMPSGFNSLIFLLREKVTRKHQIEYQLTRKDKVISDWKSNSFDNNLIWLNNLKPGGYLLKVRYAIQRSHVSELNFEIKPAWYQTTIFMLIASILVAGFGGAFIFVMLYIAQKQKTKQEQLSKTKVQLELKSIYAQLNPHFIFNAISSIQGLINKQDIEGANLYLSDFAQLIRESLINNNKELLSLNEEQKILNTYLKLEKLRFGFNYQIQIDESVDIYNTEIPVLLLQPLVENAVKHGVSTLHEKGIIKLSFSKLNNDMMVVIFDNGPGINENESQSGYGLKLTKDRISLLNKLSNDQPIHLNINSPIDSGTRIELKFSNWFL